MMRVNHLFDITNHSIKCVNGSEFIFLGVKHNVDEIKSTEGVDICWIEEGHALTEESWDIIDPTIRKEGSEIWGTFNTRFKFDFLYRKFVVDEPPKDSFVLKVNYIDIPQEYISSTIRNQINELKERDFEKYLQVYEGQVKQLAEGAIFGKQITSAKKEGRFLNIPIQKNCEVHTFSDLGKKDQTAFWFMQRVGPEYRFIDYFEGRLEEVEYYTRHLKSLGYLYGTHYMPHDANHDRLGMKRNIKQQFEDGGIKPISIVPRIKEKSQAIQMGRDIFPQCYFHMGNDERGKRMERGIEALSNYRYEYNDERDTYSITPFHDWASNGADAFLQFAQGFKEYQSGKSRRQGRPRGAGGWLGA